MPKVTNLIEAYNNFVVEPLKTEEELGNFYIERPENADAKSAKKYLFLGFRVCGKSTELNRLSRALDKNRFLIVSYSIHDELDVSNFDCRDCFYNNYSLHTTRLLRYYAFPIPLTFSPYYENVRHAFDDDIILPQSRDLLFSLTAVEYEDEEERWCDINPLLMPLVEKCKKD